MKGNPEIYLHLRQKCPQCRWMSRAIYWNIFKYRLEKLVFPPRRKKLFGNAKGNWCPVPETRSYGRKFEACGRWRDRNKSGSRLSVSPPLHRGSNIWRWMPTLRSFVNIGENCGVAKKWKSLVASGRDDGQSTCCSSSYIRNFGRTTTARELRESR